MHLFTNSSNIDLFKHGSTASSIKPGLNWKVKTDLRQNLYKHFKLCVQEIDKKDLACLDVFLVFSCSIALLIMSNSGKQLLLFPFIASKSILIQRT